MSLAVDGQGRPVLGVIAWDSANKTHAVVRRKEASGWVVLGGGPVDPANSTAKQISVAVDAQDAPWVAYTLMNQQVRAVAARWNGTTWEDQGVARHSPTGSSFADWLVHDADGQPYVAFTENVVTGGFTTFRPFVQRTSPPLSIGDTPASTGMPNLVPLPTLTFDGVQPVIAWLTSNPFTGIRVSRFASGAWQQLGGDVPAFQSEAGARVFSDVDGIHLALVGPGPGSRTRTGGLFRYGASGWTPFCAPMVDPDLAALPPIDFLSHASGAADPVNKGFVIGAVTNFGTRRVLVQRLLKP